MPRDRVVGEEHQQRRENTNNSGRTPTTAEEHQQRREIIDRFEVINEKLTLKNFIRTTAKNRVPSVIFSSCHIQRRPSAPLIFCFLHTQDDNPG
jgi:hypothetical protein